MDKFEWAKGSVTGREHIRINKNNQDAVLIKSTADYVIGIVADGCGSKTHSEVGAWLGVEILVEAIANHLPQSLTEETLDTIGEQVIDRLPKLSNFQDYYLFTLLGFVVTSTDTIVFGCGDGLFSINGDLSQLSFENNAPPYLIYSGTKLEVYKRIPTEQLMSIVIGTDGLEDWLEAKDLSQFSQSDKYFKNPDQVRRTLAIAQKTESLLADDTTLITLRRKPLESSNQ